MGCLRRRPIAYQPKRISIEVTTNLFFALYFLRLEHEPRTMWIDAICIGQDDLDERSSQVQLMREIYRGCRRAVVWLGEETYWTARVFEFLKAMDKARGWGTGNEDSKRAFRKSSAELQEKLSTDETVQRIVEKGLYGDIAQRPFWSRIWIVQEVAVAYDVLVQCGTDVMGWEDFSNAVCKWFLVDPYCSTRTDDHAAYFLGRDTQRGLIHSHGSRRPRVRWIAKPRDYLSYPGAIALQVNTVTERCPSMSPSIPCYRSSRYGVRPSRSTAQPYS